MPIIDPPDPDKKSGADILAYLSQLADVVNLIYDECVGKQGKAEPSVHPPRPYNTENFVSFSDRLPDLMEGIDLDEWRPIGDGKRLWMPPRNHKHFGPGAEPVTRVPKEALEHWGFIIKDGKEEAEKVEADP